MSRFASSSYGKAALTAIAFSGNQPVILLGERLTRCGPPPPTPKGTLLNDQILNAIDEEIARLRQARAILANSDTSAGRKTAASAVTPKARTRRKLSAKARRAIADAQRRRWAKVKSQKKATAAAATS
jgi:hypothetical protein